MALNPHYIANRFTKEIQDFAVQFAMLADQNGLSVQEGLDLAEEIGLGVEYAAEERRWQDNVPGNDA